MFTVLPKNNILRRNDQGQDIDFGILKTSALTYTRCANPKNEKLRTDGEDKLSKDGKRERLN